MEAETQSINMRLPKVEATVAFLQICHANGWSQSATDPTTDMPQDSFRWTCRRSGWRAKEVDVRAFFEGSRTTRFELRGRPKDVDRIATALRQH
jgi:hypothetical protein